MYSERVKFSSKLFRYRKFESGFCNVIKNYERCVAHVDFLYIGHAVFILLGKVESSTTPTVWHKGAEPLGEMRNPLAELKSTVIVHHPTNQGTLI